MSLTINGSGGGIPSDVNQLVYGTFEGSGSSTGWQTIPCPFGKPTAIFIIGHNNEQQLNNGSHRINVNSLNSMIIDGSHITESLKTFNVTTTGNSVTVYGKYEDDSFKFYGAYYQKHETPTSSISVTIVDVKYAYLLIY